MIKKKYSFIFLILGLILFVIFILYNYTNIFKSVISTNDNYKSDNAIVNYIKSYDTEKKSRIFFEVDDGFTYNYSLSDDYHRRYTNQYGNTFSASEYGSNNEIDKNFNSKYDEFIAKYKTNDIVTFINEIDCDYVCKRFKAKKSDGTLYIDEFVIYYPVSSHEWSEFEYHFEGKEIEGELINKLINSIKETHDASYSISKIDNGELILELLVNETRNIIINLNSNEYEELIRSSNTVRNTSVKNKNNGSTIKVFVIFKDINETYDDYMSRVYSDEYIKENAVNVDEKTFTKYSLNGLIFYIYAIDDNQALLFLSESDNYISDFGNITIKDA